MRATPTITAALFVAFLLFPGCRGDEAAEQHPLDQQESPAVVEEDTLESGFPDDGATSGAGATGELVEGGGDAAIGRTESGQELGADQTGNGGGTGSGTGGAAPGRAASGSTAAGDDAAGGMLTGTFEGTAGVTDVPRPQLGPKTLIDVRTGRHQHFDRVTFEFVGDAVPGYHIEYVDTPIRECGSGQATEVAGDGFLLVRLQHAQAHTEQGVPTVEERERMLSYPTLRELQLTCDFEAQVTWVLGVSSPNRYRVAELGDPARLAVDVKH